MQAWRSVVGFGVLFCVASVAVARGNYAASVGNDLRAVLGSETQQGHHSIGYDGARKELMGHLSLEKKNGGYVIHDVYCQRDFSRSDFGSRGGPGPGIIPNNKVLNVEHTWPQSKFGGRDMGMQKSDLHHLFPADTELNSNRGNMPFGEVERATNHLKCADSKLGLNSEGDTVFEPPVVHRGNVARALFYFSVRYQMPIDPTQEKVLRKWHEQDPVDEDEIKRNNEIETVQGNRNPFIDHPEYVSKISDY